MRYIYAMDARREAASYLPENGEWDRKIVDKQGHGFDYYYQICILKKLEEQDIVQSLLNLEFCSVYEKMLQMHWKLISGLCLNIQHIWAAGLIILIFVTGMGPEK